MERRSRPLVDARKIVSNFLKAMLVYAANCEHEAARIDRIRKTRSRHYDRLGPILSLMRDVQSLTGQPDDAAIARLLEDAHEIGGKPKKFSAEQVRKYRRFLAS